MKIIRVILNRLRPKPWYEKIGVSTHPIVRKNLNAIYEAETRSVATWCGRLMSACMDVYIGKHLPQSLQERMKLLREEDETIENEEFSKWATNKSRS